MRLDRSRISSDLTVVGASSVDRFGCALTAAVITSSSTSGAASRASTPWPGPTGDGSGSFGRECVGSTHRQDGQVKRWRYEHDGDLSRWPPAIRPLPTP